MGRFGTLALGAVIGVLAWGLVRYATLPPLNEVHYHANWAVFVDGRRMDLSGDRFMEDVGACLANAADMRPQDRVHLHDGEDQVVHVHAAGVTWGHLLANLGFTVAPGLLIDPDGNRYEDSDSISVRFVRNGEPMHDIAMEPIRSGDRVLISVGSASQEEVLSDEFPQVASNAEEYNAMADPATCRGGHEPEGTLDRIRRAFLG